jgi:hypothetical protein
VRAALSDPEAPVRKVPDRLRWVGHAGDLRDVRGVLAAGVEGVDGKPPAALPREQVCLRFPLLIDT